MIPEDRLFVAIIDNAIDASLRRPLGDLPEYDCAVGCKRWTAIRDKRVKLRDDEDNRLDGRDTINSEYMALLYKMVHHADIEPLRLLLRECWDNIDNNPDASLQYRKIFDSQKMSMDDRREWHET